MAPNGVDLEHILAVCSHCEFCSCVHLFIPLSGGVFIPTTDRSRPEYPGMGFGNPGLVQARLANVGHIAPVNFGLLLGLRTLVKNSTRKEFIDSTIWLISHRAEWDRIRKITLLALSYAANDVPLKLSVIELEGLWLADNPSRLKLCCK
ncbi:hypothetical protein F3Y22_tig00111938pilonHSYRG00005 [Hibiscus syriacus]|uniref:Uncharacterized protein n=1 Tax=Hibiscus syriacus TaxID=106335 RepID=A0A6A2X8N9_HIBSY|nr:hypothetical protein F3Y22_tig00111938pilonHSYRG00005 [Hibiscus syriacus]